MSARNTLRSMEVAGWIVGIMLLVLYFGARFGGEVERRQAIALFSTQASGAHEVPTRESSAQAFRVVDLPVPPLPPAATGQHTTSTGSSSTGSSGRLLAAIPADMQHWSPGRIQQFEATQKAGMMADGSPVALLRIARVQLEVPVYAELNERNLNRGAALVAGTAEPDSDGNVAIAAHRDGYFRALQKVAVGDVIDIELHTRKRAYRVTGISIVAPTDLWPLEVTGEAALTLVTCYPFHFLGSAPQRYIVRAEALP